MIHRNPDWTCEQIPKRHTIALKRVALKTQKRLDNAAGFNQRFSKVSREDCSRSGVSANGRTWDAASDRGETRPIGANVRRRSDGARAAGNGVALRCHLWCRGKATAREPNRSTLPPVARAGNFRDRAVVAAVSPPWAKMVPRTLDRRERPFGPAPPSDLAPRQHKQAFGQIVVGDDEFAPLRRVVRPCVGANASAVGSQKAAKSGR